MLFRVYALSHATSRRRYGRGVVVVVDHMQPTHDQTVPRRPDARAMTSTPPASVIYERGAPPPNPLPRRGSLTRRITHVIVIVFAFRPSPRCEFDSRATHYYPSPPLHSGHHGSTPPRLHDVAGNDKVDFSRRQTDIRRKIYNATPLPSVSRPLSALRFCICLSLRRLLWETNRGVHRLYRSKRKNGFTTFVRTICFPRQTRYITVCTAVYYSVRILLRGKSVTMPRTNMEPGGVKGVRWHTL